MMSYIGTALLTLRLGIAEGDGIIGMILGTKDSSRPAQEEPTSEQEASTLPVTSDLGKKKPIKSWKIEPARDILG